MNYNLENRTILFGEKIIDFIKSIKINDINRSFVSQIIRSSTSVGANYMEANEAASKKDFRNKICISKKEAHETKYWLKMFIKTNPEKLGECKKLWQEAHELTLIFSKIFTSCS